MDWLVVCILESLHQSVRECSFSFWWCLLNRLTFCNQTGHGGASSWVGLECPAVVSHIKKKKIDWWGHGHWTTSGTVSPELLHLLCRQIYCGDASPWARASWEKTGLCCFLYCWPRCDQTRCVDGSVPITRPSANKVDGLFLITRPRANKVGIQWR